MQDQNNPEKPHRRKKNQGTPKGALIIVVILFIVAAGAAIFLFSGPGDEPLPIEPLDTVPPSEDKIVQRTIPGTIPESEQTLQATSPDDVVDTETSAAEAEPETPAQKKARQCKVLAEQIHGFFNHVDSEDYMQQFQLPEPSQQYFIKLAEKLLKNPPVVSRESDDLYTILKNMAHFFRVIGKDNIILLKTILDRERDKIEDVAAEFYQWTAWGDCNDDRLKFFPSLAEMYEYAGFFLNTMGGRSYLFRRDSRSRLLVNYYSVLLIERANKQGVNRHGIDIAQIIPQLVQEIDSSNQLIYKENYIDSLYGLLEKYQ